MDDKDKRLKRIESKLSFLCGKASRETWVRGTVMTRYTIWKNKRELEWARRNNLVEYRRRNGQVEYLFEAICERFLTLGDH